MNLPKTAIRKRLHIIAEPAVSGIFDKSEIVIGYEIFNLANLSYDSNNRAVLQFGDYRTPNVGLYGGNLDIRSDNTIEIATNNSFLNNGEYNDNSGISNHSIKIDSCGTLNTISSGSTTIETRNNSAIYLTVKNGSTVSNQTIMTSDDTRFSKRVYILSGVTTTAGGGYLTIGATGAAKLHIDTNSIQTRNSSGTPVDLYLNPVADNGSGVVILAPTKLKFMATGRGNTFTSTMYQVPYSALTTIDSLYSGNTLPTDSVPRDANWLVIDPDSYLLITGGTTHINTPLNVYGPTYLYNSLYVKGDSTFTTTFTIKNRNMAYEYFKVTGTTISDGKIDITGNLNMKKWTDNGTAKYSKITFEVNDKTSFIGIGSRTVNSTSYTGLIIGDGTTGSDNSSYTIIGNDIVMAETLKVEKAVNLYSTLGVTGATTLSSNLTVNGSSTFKAGVEIYGATPYIDFHFNNSTSDYTSRIIEESSGILTVSGKLKSTFITASYGTSAGRPSNPVTGQIYFEVL